MAYETNGTIVESFTVIADDLSYYPRRGSDHFAALFALCVCVCVDQN